MPRKSAVLKVAAKAAVRAKAAPAKAVKETKAPARPVKAAGPAKPAAKAAARPAPKPAAKATAASRARPGVKSAVKAAAKALSRPAPKGAARTPAPSLQANPAPTVRPLLVRDSFTMPEQEYAVLAEVKSACLRAGIEVKKSELLRVGVALLGQVDTATLKAVLAALPQLKTGRPPAAG